MMKRALVCIMAVLAAMLSLALPAAHGSQSVLFEGGFHMTETVVSSSSEYGASPYKPAGTVSHSFYKVAPGRSSFCHICKKNEVGMIRPTGGYIEPWLAVLQPKSSTLYKGSAKRAQEFPAPSCSGQEGSDAGFEESQVTLQIVASADGKVTKIKGTIESSYPEKSLCQHARETVKFTGTRVGS